MEDLEEAAHDFCRRHRATLNGFLGSVKQLWTSRNIASRNKTGKFLEDCLGKILASEGLRLLNPERLIEVSRRLDGLYKPDLGVATDSQVYLIEATVWPDSNKLRSAIFSGLIAQEASCKLMLFAATLWLPGENDPGTETLIKFGVRRGYLEGAWGFRTLPNFVQTLSVPKSRRKL